MPTLLQDDYARVVHHVAQRVVEVIRTSSGYRDAASVAASFDAIQDGVAGLTDDAHGILFDLRDAPRENREALLRLLRRKNEELARSFARAACLVGTPLGQLQVERLRRETPEPSSPVFRDRETALRYLAGVDDPPLRL